MQTTCTVFGGFQWNLTYVILMMCSCAWHNFHAIHIMYCGVMGLCILTIFIYGHTCSTLWCKLLLHFLMDFNDTWNKLSHWSVAVHDTIFMRSTSCIAELWAFVLYYLCYNIHWYLVIIAFFKDLHIYWLLKSIQRTIFFLWQVGIAGVLITIKW